MFSDGIYFHFWGTRRVNYIKLTIYICRSLWKGNKINCGKIVPENASRLLLFNFMLDSDFLKGQDSMKVK